jgi:hypothetical protein
MADVAASRHIRVTRMCATMTLALDPAHVRLRPMRPRIRLLPLLVGMPALAGAQEVSARPAERFVGGWVGASVASSSRFGYVTDRRLLVAGVRLQYLVGTLGPIAIASILDFVPLAILSNTPDYEMRRFRQRDGSVVTGRAETGRSPVLGAGIAPLGLQLYAHSTRSVRPFVGASVGTLWFARNTPVPDARRLNISAEAAGGVELLSRDGRALVLGYKFQHLSNAGTARQNPGVDAHVVYVGVMQRRGRRPPRVVSSDVP